MSKKLGGKERQRKRKKLIRAKLVQLKKGEMHTVEEISFERLLFNSAPNMIHEDKYVSMNCVLCGVKMKSIHDTHNPAPITEQCYAPDALKTGNPNRCCNQCENTKVRPARLRMSGISPEDLVRLKFVEAA